jgi:DNA-binding FadR family transcriptional regulator
MQAPALAKPRVHLGVVRELAQRIFSGTFPPGEALPNEARLCADLAVSRTALREAVRVLGAKGLVESRPRTGTRVRPREEWNLLDLEVLDWHDGMAPDPDFVRSLLEARRILEPAAAELAAERATGRDIARMEAALEGMTAALPRDIEACCRADLDFHAALLEASHNLVFRQLIATISAALMSGFRLSTHLATSYEKTLAAHGEVLERIRLRDPAGARAAMLDLLGVAFDDLRPAMRAGGRGGVP